LCAAYNLNLSRGCWNVEKRLKALPKLDAPSGKDLEEVLSVGSDILEQLSELLKVSDSVNKDARKLHLAMCCNRDNLSKQKKEYENRCDQLIKELGTGKKVDSVLQVTTLGLLAAGIPLLLYGAGAAGTLACVGAVASAVGKDLQQHHSSEAAAELYKKREDIVAAKGTLISYSQLDFSAAPLSTGLDTLDGHLQALMDILEEMLKKVQGNKFLQAEVLREELDDQFYNGVKPPKGGCR
ncbi:hypothetical protein CLOP_g19167, partial [Closterium sp. NIES-67]